MKEYDVTIRETLEKVVSVAADSKEAAEEAVRQGYFNSEYVLDAENFKEVNFETGEGRTLEHDTEIMDVLLVKPGEYPQVIQIGTGLAALQKAVGGDIEVVYPFEEPVALICNDEGKLNGMPLNRALRDGDGDIYDIVAGDFLVVGLTEDSFGSLTPELMEQFEQRFHTPEMFLRMGRGIIALPMDEDSVKNAAKPPDRTGPDSRDAL